MLEMGNKVLEFVLGICMALFFTPILVIGSVAIFGDSGLVIGTALVFIILIFMAKVFNLKYFALGCATVFIFGLITVGNCMYSFRIG
jgi:hypothetical protein